MAYVCIFFIIIHHHHHQQGYFSPKRQVSVSLSTAERESLVNTLMSMHLLST